MDRGKVGESYFPKPLYISEQRKYSIGYMPESLPNAQRNMYMPTPNKASLYQNSINYWLYLQSKEQAEHESKNMMKQQNNFYNFFLRIKIMIAVISKREIKYRN